MADKKSLLATIGTVLAAGAALVTIVGVIVGVGFYFGEERQISIATGKLSDKDEKHRAAVDKLKAGHKTSTQQATDRHRQQAEKSQQQIDTLRGKILAEQRKFRELEDKQRIARIDIRQLRGEISKQEAAVQNMKKLVEYQIAKAENEKLRCEKKDSKYESERYQKARKELYSHLKSINKFGLSSGLQPTYRTITTRELAVPALTTLVTSCTGAGVCTSRRVTIREAKYTTVTKRITDGYGYRVGDVVFRIPDDILKSLPCGKLKKC